MQRSIINISMPLDLAKKIKQTAKEENRSQSELLREAYKVYEWRKNWARIKAVGRATALSMGIESDEDVERIAG